MGNIKKVGSGKQHKACKNARNWAELKNNVLIGVESCARKRQCLVATVEDREGSVTIEETSEIDRILGAEVEFVYSECWIVVEAVGGRRGVSLSSLPFVGCFSVRWKIRK